MNGDVTAIDCKIIVIDAPIGKLGYILLTL